MAVTEEFSSSGVRFVAFINSSRLILQAAEETAKEDSDPEQAAMMFICKRLKLNYKKLSEEEKKWLKRIAQKSDLLKNPNPQRGRK